MRGIDLTPQRLDQLLGTVEVRSLEFLKIVERFSVVIGITLAYLFIDGFKFALLLPDGIYLLPKLRERRPRPLDLYLALVVW
jgi:hypothetical protein